MTFTESNIVEQMILDSVAPKRHGEPLNIREDLAPVGADRSAANCVQPAGITCLRPGFRARVAT